MSSVSAIPGLTYVRDYLSPAEETKLAAIIDQQSWLADLKRRVQHYGYRYDYTQRKVDASMFLGPLPQWAAELAERLHHEGRTAQASDQLIVNEYQPGQGIANHIDCLPCFGPVVVSISLLSPCIMIFTHARSNEQIPVKVHPRSLLVMDGESRRLWKHGIPARKSDDIEGERWVRSRRLSLTFRNIVK